MEKVLFESNEKVNLFITNEVKIYVKGDRKNETNGVWVKLTKKRLLKSEDVVLHNKYIMLYKSVNIDNYSLFNDYSNNNGNREITISGFTDKKVYLLVITIKKDGEIKVKFL